MFRILHHNFGFCAVHDMPAEFIFSLLFTVPPSFTTKPSDQTVIENDTVVFSCAATAHPTPGITWIKDGMTVGTENNLTFTALRNDSGKYWCIAENGLNVTVEESVFLDVHCK